MALETLQSLGQIGIIFEAVIDNHLPAVVAQRFNFQALVHANPRHFLAAHSHKQVLTVQHLVVL